MANDKPRFQNLEITPDSYFKQNLKSQLHENVPILKHKTNKTEKVEGNLGFTFNHLYFTDVQNVDFDILNSERNGKYFKKLNKKICAYEMGDFEYSNLGNQSFTLTTQYPGLALGLGYGHEIGAMGEFKLGFSFDYTSGLPIIPASSVKGMLRSAFPCKKIHKSPKFMSEKESYIKSIWEDNFIDIDALEKELFEGKEAFFDAIIDSKHKGKRIVGDDSITPHGTNPLRNPKPILFLKVLSEITIKFEFLLVGDKNIQEKKLNLFKKILIDFGIGAKTNVGYGQFKAI